MDSRCVGFRSCGSQAVVVVAQGFICSTACGIFPGQGIEPVSPALTGRFLITGPPGKAWVCVRVTATSDSLRPYGL